MYVGECVCVRARSRTHMYVCMCVCMCMGVCGVWRVAWYGVWRFLVGVFLAYVCGGECVCARARARICMYVYVCVYVCGVVWRVAVLVGVGCVLCGWMRPNEISNEPFSRFRLNLTLDSSGDTFFR